MKIYMISARSANNVIGKDNAIPWNLPKDLQFFQKTTRGHAVLMGLNTWNSLPKRPLPGRKNFILCPEGTVLDNIQTVNGHYELIHDIDSFLERTDIEDVFIIGGASLYQMFIDKVDVLYLTIIDKDFDGDTYFPLFDPALFDHEVLETLHDDKLDCDYTFNKYTRK